jgi:pimeloyl-ACP methyl ester carboxylesterase
MNFFDRTRAGACVACAYVLLTSACGGTAEEPNNEVASTHAATEALTRDGGRERPPRGGFHAPFTDVLLVHGAWADASSWNAVIEELQGRGVTVHGVQLRELSLADDVSLVRNVITQISVPVVVVGHSYGGAVISGATAGQANVARLVFVAAFAPDASESLGSLNALYPATPLGEHLVFDNQANITIDLPGILEVFAPDLPPARAKALYVTQHPLAAAIFGEVAGTAGWRSIPSYFAVSQLDQAISPDLERFFAARMGAKTVELASSHVSLISHPHAIAALIERALYE